MIAAGKTMLPMRGKVPKSANLTAVMFAVSNVVIKTVAIPKNHVDLCIETSSLEFLKPTSIVYDKFQMDITTKEFRI